MRNGFFNGLLVGTVVGTVSGVLMGSGPRKAQELFNQGGQMLKMAQEGVGLAGNLVNKGRNLFHQDEQNLGPQDSGIENINQRVAVLEKRLEELSQRGV